MARVSWLVLAAAASLSAGTVTEQGRAEEGGAERPPEPRLEVSVDKAKVDLERRSLEVRMSRTAGHLKLKVFAASGEVLADRDIDFSGRAAGSALVVTWTPSSEEPVAKIEVYAYDADGNYKGIAIVPWSLEIPHEEVNFPTDSAEITKSEAPKLQRSLKLIKEAFEAHKDLGTVTLFIAGHTDTRGSTEHNRDLSRRRARAIGAWFKQHGLTLPVAYTGFGEQALKVKTRDEVDEPRNRRVDYVLAVEPPRIKSRGSPPAWSKL